MRFLLSAFLLILVIGAKADSTDKKSLLVLPIAYYTPETNVAMGLGGVGYYNFGKNRSITRPSSAYFFATYTLNDQWLFDLPFHIFTKGERWYIHGELAYYDFPFKFYGIGNDINAEHWEFYTSKQSKLIANVYTCLGNNWYGGARLRHINYHQIVYKERGLLAAANWPYKDGGISSGMGLGVLFDSRNNVYSAQNATYWHVGITAFPAKVLNIGNGFAAVESDFRIFRKIANGSVFAMQAYSRFTWGDVPFFMLSEFGGLFNNRGYYRAAHRDKHVSFVQAELRQHIYRRFGAVIFGGLASVANKISQFKIESIKPSMGLGLRFMLNRKEQIPFRIDYAIGQGFGGYYFTTGEAF